MALPNWKNGGRFFGAEGADLTWVGQHPDHLRGDGNFSETIQATDHSAIVVFVTVRSFDPTVPVKAAARFRESPRA